MTTLLWGVVLATLLLAALLLTLVLMGLLVTRWWWAGYSRLNGESWLDDPAETWRGDVRRRV